MQIVTPRPFQSGRHVYRTQLALVVMRRYPKETHLEERDAALKKLRLPQTAISNAGFCDGGEHYSAPRCTLAARHMPPTAASHTPHAAQSPPICAHTPQHRVSSSAPTPPHTPHPRQVRPRTAT